ncbi:MAG: tetratricopeptide repeat protein [Kiritimatiellae bacterium]|nr:tetratricopeptide repeat protein [Kiritimatiellia bacterium]
MSTENSPASEPKKPLLHTIPENLPEELLPLYDWWKTKGPTFLAALAAAALLVGGAFAYRAYRASKTATANQEILKAASLEDLENVVAKFGSTKAASTARLRLAKAYYDASNYAAALQTYDDFLKKGAPKAFREIGELGRAHALEGLNRLDEALADFQRFEQTHPEHFLYPQAVMGVARVLTLLGRKDEAKNRLEKLKAEKTEDEALNMVIANLDGIITRYAPRAERSLFDMAAEAAAKTAPEPEQQAPTEPPAAAPQKQESQP